MVTVSVKWQKEVYPAVEIDTSQPPYVFKCQLYDLTGVPPERQKIMVKGGLLKDDADWSRVGVKEGQRLMMMGTADEIVKAPEKGPIFVEDMPEEEQVVNVGHSAGLFNLGNTCYMNSTVQCLHSVPELKSSLTEYNQLGKSNDLDHSSHLLTVATRDLFNDLDKNVKPVAPMQFWMVLRKKYPQFGQQSNGAFMQQDAEECWTQLLYTLSQSLKSPNSSEGQDIVKTLFGIDFDNRIHCAESGEESTETETVYSLKCHISQEVNHLHEGLKRGLKSELEKASPSLGRSAVYVKDSRINGLPRYLTIQFVRFFWKRESNQKAKILRKVDYPLSLDVYDLCSDNLRKKLEGPRQVLRDAEGKKAGLKTSAKTPVTTDNALILFPLIQIDSEAKMSKEVIEEGQVQQHGKDYVDPPPAPLLDFAELKLWSFYRALIAEFIATLLFLYVTVATVIGHKKLNGADKCDGVGILGIAWAFGGMIFVLVYCTAGISGGHINPAVTFGLFLARKVSLVRAVGYIIAQCLGAICGVGFVKAFMTHPYNALGGGANFVQSGYNNGTALGAEIIGTFVLVYTVFSATDPKRSARDSHIPVLAPLPIGFAVFMVHLATIPITGTGINPARSFGAAVIADNKNVWDDQWIFWVGPFVGALLAAAYHQYILRAAAIKALGSFRSNATN